MNGNAPTAILAASSAANQQALTGMAETFATALKEKSAEDQARFDTIVQKFQERMDMQAG